jgi:hypothetical protein
LLWNLYLFSFAPFLDVPAEPATIFSEMSYVLQAILCWSKKKLAIQCFAYHKLILPFGDLRFWVVEEKGSQGHNYPAKLKYLRR